jgi:hypothetical protein
VKRLGALVLAYCLVAAVVAAEPQTADPLQPARRPSWGLGTSLGYGGAGGDFSDLLQKPITGDYNIFRNHDKWRFGLGVSFTSFTMKEPCSAVGNASCEDQKEWGFQQTYLFTSRMFGKPGGVRPYIQVRGGLARLHPRSELFAFEPPPEEPGDSPTTPANGFSFGVLPGIEVPINRSLALDVSGHFNYFSVDEYDLSAVQRPPASSGTTWEARVGVRWHPDDGFPSGSPLAGHPARHRDGWGVSKNLGWAMAENLAINWGASGSNEYTRNANFNQISPRSWWANFEEGFTFDDNKFKTNQYVHPWNGGMYFNTGRSNGFGFWESSLFAIGGAFFWECCGETHPMSYNDMISTGIGGIAVGEQMYRMSGQLLDNEDTGKSRVFREIGGFLIAPVRGFNRLLSGRASTVHPRPSEPLDWRGPHATFFVFVGARTIGEGESISENTKTHGYFGLGHSFGSVFDNARRRPFDSLAADYQFSPGDKQTRTALRIRGDLASWTLGKSETPHYAFAIVQHFDYHNNNAYEFGQQAFGPSFFARYRLSEKMGLHLRWDGSAAVLAAVNSDYSYLADVANQERLREYDYGPGLGTSLEVGLTRGGNRLLSMAYRFQWISVNNGSIFNPKDGQLPGSDANHYLQSAGAKLFVPVYKSMGLGAEGLVLLRKSFYGSPSLVDKSQRNPEARLYIAWDLGS